MHASFLNMYGYDALQSSLHVPSAPGGKARRVNKWWEDKMEKEGKVWCWTQGKYVPKGEEIPWVEPPAAKKFKGGDGVSGLHL